MLRTGKEHLERLRDGRVVYIGKERIDDVTTHPAFRHAAQTAAQIYDVKADPANRETMTFEEDGERYSSYYILAKDRDDLRKRSQTHRKIAEVTHGFFGRSPDHVSSFVTGMCTKSDVLDTERNKFSGNLHAYYEHMRRNDIYAAYAVLPPQAARDPAFYQKQNLPIPTLQLVREDDDGVVISGMKMLATAAVIADEIWIGNVIPLAPDQSKQAITCAIPCNTPGLSLWSRKPMEPNAANQFDNPLTWRLDETDAMVMCDEVKVPWERVFVLDDPIQSYTIYNQTPSHCYGNHQSNVRFHTKMRLLVGIASKITQSTGANKIPAVAETLGRLSALEAGLGGMVAGQIEAAEDWPEGYATFNRRMMYAALNWSTENHSQIIDIVRELCGGGVFQMPADVTVMHDDELRQKFESFWQTPQMDALARMKLFRLAWDLVGSEFAGRHQQYEKFYAGASFIIRGHSFREAPWGELDGIVDDLLATYDVPPA
ncbi:MAG: 4-hydroxyphenylacetate 3-hydroxylase N-terminal domain-containing protein [Alphaproteobacteria bacterium]|jgi:4-hydroxyphenylacetate 3-monooxygenase